MRSSRSAAGFMLVLVTVAMLVGFSGMAVANIVADGVTVTSPATCVYWRPGTAGNIVTVQGQVCADRAGEPITIEALFGTARGSTTITGVNGWQSYEVAVDLTGQPDGMKELFMVVSETDMADGPSSVVLSLPDRACVDGTAPTFASLGTRMVEPEGSYERPRWIWTIDPDTSGVVQQYLYLYHNGMLHGDPIALAGDVRSWRPAFDLTDGIWNVDIVAVDYVGNASLENRDAGLVRNYERPLPYVWRMMPPSPGNISATRWDWYIDHYGSLGITSVVVQLYVDDPVTGAHIPVGEPVAKNWADNIFTAELDRDGIWRLGLTAYYTNGANSGLVICGEYMLDTTPPNIRNIQVLTPSPGNDTTPEWSWEIDDLSGIAELVVVPIATGAMAPVGVYLDPSARRWVTDPALLEADDWSLLVMARDAVGNYSEALGGPYTLTFDDITPPQVSNVRVVTTNPSSGQYPMWRWDINEPGSGVASQWLQLYHDGTPIGGTISVPSDASSWYPSAPLGTDGTWEIGIVAMDNEGNVSQEVRGGAYVLDTTAPVVVISPPDPIGSGDLHRPQWNWTVNDAGSGVNVQVLQLYCDGVAHGAPISLGADVDTWQSDFDLTAGGTWTIGITATDNVENEADEVLSEGYVVDDVPPVFQEARLTSAIRLLGSLDYTSRPSISVTIDEQGSGFDDGGTVRFSLFILGDPNPVYEATCDSLSIETEKDTGIWTTSHTVSSDLPPGPYHCEITATDDSGNSSTCGLDFGVDGEPPVATGSEDAAVGSLNDSTGLMFTNSQTISVAWDAFRDQDGGSGFLGYSLEIWPKNLVGPQLYPTAGTPLYTAGVLDSWEDSVSGDVSEVYYLAPTGSFREVWTSPGALPLVAGQAYGAWIRALDMLHNGSDWFDPPFIYDPDPPTAPGVPAVKDLTSPYVTDNNRPTLVWTHSTDGQATAQSGVDLYEVQLGEAGSGRWDINYQIDIADEDVDKSGADAPFAGSFEWVVSVALADGTYAMRVRAKDVAGNYSSWVESAEAFTVNAGAGELPSAVPILAPLPAYTNASSVTFNWSQAIGAVSYEIEYTIGSTTDTDTTTLRSFPVAITSAADGDTVSARVRGYSASGVAGEWSDAVSTIVDRTPPAVTVVVPSTPTTNARPQWTWTSVATVAPLDHYVVRLDSEPPFNTVGESYQPVSDLPHGTHQFWVGAVDEAGNVLPLTASAAVFVDTVPPAVPRMDPLAAGYRTSPVEISWPEVTDGSNLIAYQVQYAANELFTSASSFITFTNSLSVAMYSEGEFWLRVRTVAQVAQAQYKYSDWSLPASAVYDQTAPAAPVLTLETPPVTNKSPQTWSWSAPYGAVGYKVKVDNGEFADVGNVNTYQTTFTSTGSHEFAVLAYDWLGNEDQANAAVGSVYVDLTAPDAPADLEVVPARTNLTESTWTWAAVADAVSYEVELDGGAPINVGNTYSHTATNLSEGIHTLRVRALDDTGNPSGWSDAADVEVDRTAPAIPTAPSTLTPTASTTQTWTWDAVPDVDLVRYEVSVDGAVAIGNGVSTTYGTSLTHGAHFLQVRTADDLGNTSSWSERGYVDVDTVGPEAPVVTLVTPNPTNAPQVWQWTWPSDAVWFQVAEWIDGVSEPTTILADGAINTVVTGFEEPDTDTVRFLMVRAIDALGNAGEWSTPAVVFIDTLPPVVPVGVSVVSPTTDNTPTWTWQDADAQQEGDDGEGDVEGFEILLDGIVVIDVGDVLSYTHSEMLSDGAHTLQVRSYDYLGNRSEWSEAVTVLIDTVPPAVPAIAPLAAGYATSPITIDWSDVSDGANSIAYVLEYADNGGFANPTTVTGLAVSTYEFDSDAEGEGHYWFRVKTVSTLPGGGGTKESGWSPTVSTVYDETAPGEAALVLETDNPTNKSPQKWSWSVPDGAVGYKVSVDGAGFIDVGNVNTYLTAFSTTGVHTFAVMAYDWLGNEDEDNAVTGSVTVDVTPPAVPMWAVTPGRTNALSPIWSWSSIETEPGQTYDVMLDTNAPVSVGSNTTYTAVNLSEGSHTLAVRAVDALGNHSDWLTAGWATVDRTAPAIPTAPLTTTPTASTNQVWTWDSVIDDYLSRYEVSVNGGPAIGTGLATTCSTEFGEGVHYLQVRSIDDLGNTSAWSEKGWVTVDTTAPQAPVMVALPEFTRADSVTFTWAAVIDAMSYTVSHYKDGALVLADSGVTLNSYTVDISTAAGWAELERITANVVAVDAVGNESAVSNIVGTTIDRTPPTVEIVSPPALTRDPRPMWSWSATATGAEVDHYLVSLDVWPAIETISDHYYPSSDLADGGHLLMVIAVDRAGNQSAVATSLVTVDATVAVPTGPVANPNPTNVAPVWEWAEVTDPHGPVTYNVYFDGGATPVVTGSVTRMWSPASIPTPDGLHYLEIEAVDGLGNVSPKSERGYVLIDTTGPLAPAAPRTTSPTTSSGTQAWTWDYVEDGATFEVQTSEDGLAWSEAIPVGNALSYATDFTGDGVTRYLRVRAHDALGNVGYAGNPDGWSAAGSVFVDTVAPQVPEDLEVGESPTGNNRPTWTWTASTSPDAASYEVSLDGAAAIDIGDATSYTASALADGIHVLKVRTIDLRGNVSGWTAEVMVDVDTTVATPKAPAAAVSPTNTIPVWTWAGIVDPNGPVSFRVYLDGILVETSHDQLTWSPASIPTPDGLHYLEIEAVDGLGNVSLRSERGYVLIDTTGPLAPAAPRTTSPTTSGTQAWTWDYVEDGATFEVQTSEDGATWSEAIPVGNALSYATDFTGDGVTRYLRVRAYDALGNVGYAGNPDGWSAPGSVFVDTVAPQVPEDLEVDETPTANNRPTWTWTASTSPDAASYEVSLDGAAAIDIGDATSYTASALADGIHVLKVRTIDLRGNVSGWTAEVMVDVDTTVATPQAPAAAVSPTNAIPVWTWAGIVDPNGPVSFRVYLDGIPVETSHDQLTWSPASIPTPDGLHYLEIEAVDGLGNVSLRSERGYVLIDTTGPMAPAAPRTTSPTTGSTQAWTWDYVEDGATFEVQTSEDGATWSEAIPVGNALSDVTDFTGDGVTRYLRVRAHDALGNVGYAGNPDGWSAPGSVFVDTVAPGTPTGLALTDPEGTIVAAVLCTADGTPKVMWNGVGGTDLHHYVVEIDGQEWTQIPAATVSHEFTHGLRDGVHIVRILAVDALGNASAYSAPLTFVVDTTPPAVPGIPKPEETPTRLTTPAWTWKASAGAASYNVYLDDELIANVTSPAFSSANYTEFGVSALTEGRHAVQVTALDELSNESVLSAPGMVEIDLTAPPVPVLNPLQPYTNAPSILFTWAAVESAVKYDLDGIAEGIEVPAHLLTLDPELYPEGAGVITRVRAYDMAGNVSAWSNQVKTIVDRTGPTTTAVQTPPEVTNNPRPVWEWSGDDGSGSGLAYFIVTIDNEPPLNTIGMLFEPARALLPGAHVLKVRAVDALGNVGNELVFPTVTIVEPVLLHVTPGSGAYPINHISTVALSIAGLMDVDVTVAIDGTPLEPWRVVAISRSLPLSKFYILLDEDVLSPGEVQLIVGLGLVQYRLEYEVLNERSGFGFGRLRPW